MVKVAVKWNKRVFEDVEVAPNVVQFKTKLQELTGVPAARQKLMAKGAWKGILKDDMDLTSCSIKEGQQVTLMGSAEVLAAPKEEIRFVEDMKSEDLAQSGAVLPAGFINLGNTCYMNATLQCMRKVPELREALTAFTPSSRNSDGNLASLFTASLSQMFNSADRSTEAVPPTVFIQVLRQLFPQFAQQGPRDVFMQQDAEELYSAVVNTLAICLKEPTPLKIREGDEVRYLRPPNAAGDGKEAGDDANGEGSAAGHQPSEERAVVVKVHQDVEGPHYTIRTLGKDGKEKNTEASRISKVFALSDLGKAENLVDALFGLEMEEEFKCEESGESKISSSKAKKLVCNIQGGAGSNTQINHLTDGMKIGLTDKVEKHSDKLGRDAVFTMQSRIKRLPRYLCVQVLRFFWKVTPDSMDHQGVKCKIMRPVTFPSTLDVYEFCAPSLQAILKVPRDKADKLIFERESKEKADREAKITAEREEKEKKRGKVFGHLTAGRRVTSGATATVTATPASAKTEAEAEATSGASASGIEESKGSTPSPTTPAAASGGEAMDVDVDSSPTPETISVMVEGEVDNEEDSAELRAALAMSMEVEDAGVEGAVGPGLPSDFKGNYELFAVVTHKGREADGGHYMGWVRQDGDDWLVFDDADVSPCKTEDIMNLKGGGDWHMAYLTFYRFKD